MWHEGFWRMPCCRAGRASREACSAKWKEPPRDRDLFSSGGVWGGSELGVFSTLTSVPRPAALRAALAAALLSLAVGGCATGDISMVATIAGGQKLRVPIGRNGVALTNQDGIQINAAHFTLNAEKKVVFVFEFTDSRKRTLRNVRVEDVSDEAPDLLVESTQPTLSPAGQWRGESTPLPVTHSRLSWLATIPNTLRVFRFTLTFADGQTAILHQGMLCPAATKSAVRQAGGLNY